MAFWIDTAPAAGAQALFGLPPVTRLTRSIAKLSPPAGPAILSDGTGGALGARVKQALLAASGPLIIVDGATVVDSRLLAFLGKADTPVVAFHGQGAERAAIARLTTEQAALIDDDATSLLAVCDALATRGVAVLPPDAMPSFIGNLRRSLDYWLFAVPDAQSRRRRERWMFESNYKGSTDVLTKWVYPPLVWRLTRLCAHWHIHPNWITIVSILCTFAAVPFFAQGQFLIGFILAFIMSVLDSVDGKVARVTLTDSPLGNILDHGTDIVHPPLWYGAWALGLGAAWSMSDPLFQMAVWLVIIYTLDRIVLGIAKARFKRTLHAMSPLDEKVRSVIARRNINMVIFGVALLIGQGEAGLLVVTLWQGLTLAWHIYRTIVLKPLRA